MTSLKLYFLGTPRIELDGKPTESDTRKATALLAYLALTGEPQTRDALAVFLWPDFGDSRAKAALRRTLSALKSSIGEKALSISRESLALQMDAIWCDALQFQHILTNERPEGFNKPNQPNPSGLNSDITQLETAVTILYRDHFLSGFSLRDSLPFDEWQRQRPRFYEPPVELAVDAKKG